jgi:hypothetical protein
MNCGKRKTVAKQVVNGAMMQCTFGVAPATLTVLPLINVTGTDQPAATVQDYKPVVNIGSFVMCTSPSNPQVAAAQGAPVPCVPVTTSPWSPGSTTTTLQDLAALVDSDTCKCMWSGVISITFAGQTIVDVDG